MSFKITSRFPRAERLADILEAEESRLVATFASKRSRKRTRKAILPLRAKLREDAARILDAFDAETRDIVISEARQLIANRRAARKFDAMTRRAARAAKQMLQESAIA